MIQNEKKEHALRVQKELIERGIDAFGSQEALARALGMRRQQLHRYQYGKTELLLSTYLHIKTHIDTL